MRTCEAAAACFPGSLHVGVDLMFAAGWRRTRSPRSTPSATCCPGLLGERAGDTYAAQIDALLSGRFRRHRRQPRRCLAER